MPSTHASTMCISTWSFPFSHHEGTVSFLPVWTASLEAILLVDSHTETIILTFLQNWIAQFDAPKSVITDRGPQFESRFFAKLCEFLGCERNRTTAYHPTTNGMVERLHCQLKAALMSHADREHWVYNLLIDFLGIRTSFKPNINACAVELVYGSTLRLSGEFLEQTLPAPGDIDFANSPAVNNLNPHASPTPHSSSIHV